MMRLHLWLIITLFGTAACSNISPTPATPLSAKTIPDDSTPIGTESSPVSAETKEDVPVGTVLPNLILQVEGEVFVRHEGQASDQHIPVGIGSRVAVGDLLYMDDGSETAIFCGDESLWEGNPRLLTPDDGFVGVPCLAGAPPPPAPDLSRLRGEMDTTPDDVAAPAPYVLSPRGGWVSDERPLFRWHSPPGVETVTLTLVSDDGIERPPVTVSGREITYPAEWEPLQAGGAGYRLQISGGITSTGFSLLEAETISQLHQQAEAIQTQIETEPGRTLVLAELYLHSDYDLWSEAADLLLAVPDGEGETAVQKQLGQIYLLMGLFDKAQVALSHSLQAAQRDNLPEAAASSLYLLGWATCGLGQVPETQTHWENALQQYQTLGIAEMSEEIKVQLSRAGDTCPLR